MNGNTKLFESGRVEKLAALFLVAASLFVAFKAADALLGLFRPQPVFGNVITVEGQGSVIAIPDIARITFSVSEEADTAKDAQDKAAAKVNAALELVKNLAIEERDVKTTSYFLSPKYSRPQPCFNGFCPDYEQTIVGYTVSQTVEVKVRDTAKAGGTLSALGTAGVSNLFGPDFTIDDPEVLKDEAREKAIEDARAKASALADDLGVRLVRVTGFWENTGGGSIPFAERAYGLGGDSSTSVMPSVPSGENEILVTVSVTYEIR